MNRDRGREGWRAEIGEVRKREAEKARESESVREWSHQVNKICQQRLLCTAAPPSNGLTSSFLIPK